VVQEYIYFNLDDTEIERVDSEAMRRGRSRSFLLTSVVKKATNDYTDFSIIDAPEVGPLPSPRQYQVYIRLSAEERKAVELASFNHDRRPAAVVYMAVMLATSRFTDFSLIDRKTQQEELIHEPA
jgi:hypothetical protein